MPVETTEEKNKDGDKNADQTDQTASNSNKTDERMRTEISQDLNRNWWKVVSDKQAANLPQLAVDGPVDGVPDGASAEAQPKAPTLDPETVKKYADELHKAINRDSNGFLGIGGGDDPDNNKITDLLDSLTPADRKAIEEAYLNADGNKDHKTLREELQKNLDGDDWRKAEAILNRRDDRTNDAGNLMVALSAINDDRSDAERRVLETFSTLNKEQMKVLEEEFKKDYGMTIDEALKKFDVSGDAMKAVGFLRKPIEERTKDDIKEFARFAIEKKNLDYFGIALRGDTEAAKQAREELSKDNEFKEKIQEAFKVHKDGGALGFIKNTVSLVPGGDVLVGGFNLVEGLVKGDLDFDRLTEGTSIDKLRSAVSSKEVDSKLLQAMDILHDGRVSLATIAADNTGSIFGWFDNKKAIGNAADNATDGERELFSRGYEIAKSGGTASSDEDKNALNFYTSIKKAFDDAGDDKESAKWQDKLLNGHGGSVISAIADGDGENGRFAAVEGISNADWDKLKDTKEGPAFRKELEEYIASFTEDDETKKLMDLIDKKAAAESFEESQKINRSLFDVIEQNKGHDFLFIGTDYDGKNVTAAIANLSVEEAGKYKNDASFRSDVDKFVNDNLDGAEKSYAKRLLSQINESGVPAKQDAVSTLLNDKINGTEAKDAFGDVEAVLKDENLRAKLKNGSELNEEEKQLKSIIDGYLVSAVIERYGIAAGDGATQANTEEYSKTLYETGRLSVEQKAQLGLRTKDFFVDAATVSADERQKLYDSKLLGADDKQLIDTLVKQDGKMDLADEIRSFVLKDGTDVEQFADKLKALTPEQKQALRDAYTKKYGSTIDDDILSRVGDDDRNNFRTYLTAGKVDGRQDFYDNLEKALKSESGISPDGSQEVLERSLTDQAAMLSDFQSRFEKLPADKQELANKYFSEALKDYQTSKEAFAEKLYQVAVIVGGVAVGVATGGVGLAALATVAAVGAVGRVALKKVVQGEDYDLSLSNVLKDGAIGAITAGASVIGPETIGAFAGIGRIATQRFVTAAGEQVVEQALKQGGKEIIEKEVNNLIAHAVVRGEPISEQAINQVINKAAAEGISQSERKALETALKTSIEQGGKEVSEQAITQTLSGTVRQAATYGTIGGTANVAIEASVGLANGQLDISNLPAAFATGFAVGSTLSVGFEAVSRNAARFKSGGTEAPAGATEHIDLTFTKGDDGSIVVKAPEGKDIDLTVKVDGKDQTLHVDQNGAKLPDGAETLGINGAEIGSPKVQALDESGAPAFAPESTPASPPPTPYSSATERDGLVTRFKNWLRGSQRDLQTQPVHFDHLRDTRITVDGREIPINNGRLQLGRENIGTSDVLVSRNHGDLRWNETDKSFYYTDTSTNGTWVKKGDSFEALPKGKEVKLDPNAEVRLGSPSGPKLEFFNLNRDGYFANVDRQVYVNGEPADLRNGSFELGRNHQNFGREDLVNDMISKNHGTVSIDQATGKWIYTDHSTNGSYIKHADGSFSSVSKSQYELKPGDEIHLGAQDGPTVKVQDTPGRLLQDGNMLYRRVEGDWIVKRDGSRVFEDRAGSRVVYNANGSPIESSSAYGLGAKFDYNQNGQLQSVKFSNGARYSTTDGSAWKIERPGYPDSVYSGKISAERDGAIRFENSEGKSLIQRGDGSQELIVPGHQTRYREANPVIETQKLEALAHYRFPDEAQAARFTKMMRTFESRGLPPTEIAETYRQINRLLSASDGAKLGPFERARLSEQILFQSAYPHAIDQGVNSTCNVTTLETKAFETNPSAAARLITDVALTGKYVTPNGVTVDVGRTGGLVPDGESLRSLQEPFRKKGIHADIKVDGSRSYAGQIFENTAVNIHYADIMSGRPFYGDAGYTYQTGDVIQYKKVALKPGETGSGEQLVAYRSTPKGVEEIPIDKAPGLYTGELAGIYNRIVPATDTAGTPFTGVERDFVVMSPVRHPQPDTVQVQSPQDLEHYLLWAQQQKKFPIVLEVDARDPLFNLKLSDGGDGGPHVITVEGIHYATAPDGSQVLKVDYYNQWGLRSNRVGQDAVDINDLFRASILRDKNGNFPQNYLPLIKNPPPPPPPPKPYLLPTPPTDKPMPFPAPFTQASVSDSLFFSAQAS